MRNRWILLVVLAIALAFVAGAVRAVDQYKAKPLDRQNLGVIDAHSTVQTQFVVLSGWGPSDSMHVDARAGIAATLSVTVTGAPAEFHMFLEDVANDWADRPMRPSSMIVDPGSGTVSSSFTFVAGVRPSNFTVNIMWRSPTGAQTTLTGGTLVVQYGSV